jgi:translation elongation factor EF-G
VTEESDCLAVVVSEERGAISLASGGEIELDVTMERLAERLKQPFAQRGRIVPAESRAHSPADAGEVRP